MIEQPPFQIEETGWGEFTIKLSLYFNDDTIDPVVISHTLRLHQEDRTQSVTPCAVGTTTGTCIVSETYETLVFPDPNPLYYDLLMAGPSTPPMVPPFKHHRLFNFF
eukprot:GHVR01102049.1.p1 GENE.GHVR01102049.1~~GHVR01102049.1.p1  ORF type:complete len:107 (-),score=24.70 GHVR01102049.1:341-661(-)